MSLDDLNVVIESTEVEVTVEDVSAINIDSSPDVIVLMATPMGPQGPPGVSGLPEDIVVPAGTRILTNKFLATDQQPAFRLMADGTLGWGAGGNSALDVNLFRSVDSRFSGGIGLRSAYSLASDNAIVFLASNRAVGLGLNPAAASSPNTFVGLWYDSGNARAELSALSGGVAWRDIFIGGSSRLIVNNFALGTAGSNFDVTMQRNAVGLLDLRNNLMFGSNVDHGISWVDGSYGYGGLRRMSADGYTRLLSQSHLVLQPLAGYKILISDSAGVLDTSIYRAAAGALGTDGQFYVYNNSAEAQPVIRLVRNGTTPRIDFGPGGSTTPDTNLYRLLAQTLKTDQVFKAGLDVYAQDGAATQVRIGNSSGQASLAFGSAFDTILSRIAAGAFGSNSGIYVQASPLGIGFSYNPASYVANNIAFQSAVTGETNRFTIMHGGEIRWGPGVAAPYDTNLYRGGLDLLKTDDSFYALKDIVANYGVAANQIWLRPSGGIGFGAPVDTAIFRDAAGVIATDGWLRIGANTANEGIRFYDKASNGYGAIWRANTDGSLNLQAQTGILLRPTAASKVYLSNETGVMDTTLYRSAANVLKTDSAFIVQTSLASGTVAQFENTNTGGAASGVLIKLAQNSSTNKWLTLNMGAVESFFIGSRGGVAAILVFEGDTSLYRQSVNALRTDGALFFGTDVKVFRYQANVLAIGDGTTPGALIIAPASNATATLQFYPGFNGPNPAFQINGIGTIGWGAGGASAADVSLSRGGVGQLQVGNSGFPNYLRVWGGAVGDGVIQSLITSDSQLRFDVRADGKIWWGPGNASVDTNLFRFTTNFLGTNSDFVARQGNSGQISLQSVAGIPMIFFGSAQDTALYRSGANVLKTDGIINAVGGLQINGVPVGTSGLPKITTSPLSGGPPASPANGDIWYATGVGTSNDRWAFQYNASSASAYKWEFIGGIPLRAYRQPYEGATTGAAWVDYGGPSVVWPRAGEMIIEFGASFDIFAETSYVCVMADGNIVTDNLTNTTTVGGSQRVTSSMMTIGVIWGPATLKMMYQATSTADWGQRWLKVTPVRIS